MSPLGPRLRQYIATLGLTGGKSSSIIGTNMTVAPRFAALANGTSIHADDYDDTGSALHVAAPALPPAFAVCEAQRRSGKGLMLAFHVGVEGENKIGDAISSRPDGDGFHTPGTCGTFGRPRVCAGVAPALSSARDPAGLFAPTLLDASRDAGYDASFDELAERRSFVPPSRVVSTGARGLAGVELDARTSMVLAPPGLHLDLGANGKVVHQPL